MNHVSVELRPVVAEDLPFFLAYQRDEVAFDMVAYVPRERNQEDQFYAHWQKILADDHTLIRTIVFEGQVAGYVMIFDRENQREVAYWIDRALWGKGLATAALSRLLKEVGERPLYAGAIRSNTRSLKVLQNCGFVITGEVREFARGRGEDVDTCLLKLEQPSEPCP